MSGGLRSRNIGHGFTNLIVGPTPADQPAGGLGELSFARMWIRLQKLVRSQDPRGGAETALGCTAFHESLLYGGELSLRGYPFHRPDLFPVGLDCQNQAGFHQRITELHDAESALPAPAGCLDAPHLQSVTKEVEQKLVVLDQAFPHSSVHTY